MRSRSVVAAIAGAVAGYIHLARRRQLSWGATDQESNEPLAGDDLIAHADLTATRAITISASAAQIWPWIAQLGRAGAASTVTTFSRIWPAATYTARIGSCLSGRTSELGTTSGSLQRSVSSWRVWNVGDPSFSTAGFRLGPARPRTTSPGRLRYELSRTERRDY
jgi:hypothetical protein